MSPPDAPTRIGVGALTRFSQSDRR